MAVEQTTGAAPSGDGAPVRRVLAVDGGNTKTIAVIVTAGLDVVGVGHGGCTDIYNTESPLAACTELSRTIHDALDDAGCTPDDLHAGVFSLAGADWPEDHELLAEHLADDLRPHWRPHVVNDAIGALRVGGPQWEGISVICGTGNAVGARHRGGSVFHVGFWPDVVGSLQLSRDALAAVNRDHLGVGPATSLTARALVAFDCEEPMEILHRFTMRDGLGRDDLVKLSPILLDEADAGDAVAVDIVTAGGRAMGRQARVCASRVGLEIAGTPVVMGGGVFGHASPLLESSVMHELDDAIAVRMHCPPVVGAMMAALDAVGADSGVDELHRSLEQRVRTRRTG